MSYDPTTWKSGDVVTSAKLNKIEQGIANAGGGGGVLIVNVTETESGQDYVYTCDKTAQEILTALESSAVVFKYENGFIEACVAAGPSIDGYKFVRGGTSAGDLEFVASNLTDYPSYVD